MRGKGVRRGKWQNAYRITPAYAGKSCLLLVHLIYEKGSPPPMRGKVQNMSMGNGNWGITPAYAGKSAISLRCGCLWRDHPRLCGEKLGMQTDDGIVKGSPPPMRGKAALQAVPLRRSGITPAYAGKRTLGIFMPGSLLRITPAYAGKSDSKRAAALAVWDHPRLCGEKPVSRISLAAFPGAPPPMRGKGNLE